MPFNLGLVPLVFTLVILPQFHLVTALTKAVSKMLVINIGHGDALAVLDTITNVSHNKIPHSFDNTIIAHHSKAVKWYFRKGFDSAS